MNMKDVVELFGGRVLFGGALIQFGITIGPAVTFGYLAAKHAVARARHA